VACRGWPERFGAGPKTAVIAAVALWFGSYLLSLIGHGMVGLYRDGLAISRRPASNINPTSIGLAAICQSPLAHGSRSLHR
jgi:hypothetical protein